MDTCGRSDGLAAVPMGPEDVAYTPRGDIGQPQSRQLPLRIPQITKRLIKYIQSPLLKNSIN